MAEYGLIGEDIQTLQEQLQSFRGTFTEEEYEEVSEKIEEIKRKSLELPSRSPMETSEILRKIVDLEMDTFSKEVTEENAKDVKRAAFLKQLRYISIYTKRGIDTEKVIETAEEYWETIKGYYDDIEQRSVAQEIDEIKLEATLNKIKNSKKIDMSEINLEQNYYLVRQRLQELGKVKGIREEDKLLIESLLGESTDIKSGKIDINVMKQQLKNPKLWSLLSGVEENTKETGIKHVSEQGKAKGESEERTKEIEEICTKYGVDETKVRDILDSGERCAYILGIKKGFFKPRIVYEVRTFSDMAIYERKEVKVIIYNNNIRELQRYKDKKEEWQKCEAAREKLSKPERVILPDNLLEIGDYEFAFNENLKEIRLPNGLRVIGNNAFECTGLESIVIPDSVKKMGYAAFYRSNIVNLTLGSGIEVIDTHTFEDCKITTLEIPGNVKVLCGGFSHVHFDEDLRHCGAFSNNPLETLILHEGLKEIQNYVFKDTKLDEINLPYSVREAGDEIANKYTTVKRGVKRSQPFSLKNILPKDNRTLEALRNERAELEKKLRIINQQIKEKESVHEQER